MSVALAALAWVTASCWAQDAYVGAPGAKWQPLAAERAGQTVTLSLAASDAVGGRTLVVPSKPAWMVLDDEVAPVLRALTADGRPVEAEERLDLTADKHGPQVRVVLADEANPVDPASVAIALGGRRLPPAAIEKADDGLAATFDLSSLSAGAYAGTLEARDLAPAANMLRVPLRLAVDGVLRQADGQTVTIARAGREYTIGGAGKGQGFLRLGADGPAAYLSTQVGDKFVYARNVVGIEGIDDGRGVRLRADVIGIDDQDFGQMAELEFDVTTHPDLPGILVTSRARNLGPAAEVYCFWGWLPGNGFVTLDGEQAWSMTYRDIGKIGWVFLPPGTPGAPGTGMMSALRFGESRFGTLLLYTDPQRIETPTGGAVEMRLAFVQTDSAETVADAYETLQGLGWLEEP